MRQTPVPLIQQMMNLHGNDWGPEDTVFRKVWRDGLSSHNPSNNPRHLNHHIIHNHTVDAWRLRQSLSILIPVYNGARYLKRTLHVLRAQNFFKHWPNSAELIVVDDGTRAGHLDDPVNEYDLVLNQLHGLPLRFYELQHNVGRSDARNVALYFAEGDIALFLDCDMLLEEQFLTEHMIRHQYLTNLALLGFRGDDLSFDDPTADLDSTDVPRFEVDWRRDWRCRDDYKVKYKSTLNGRQLCKNETLSIYDETNGFKKWTGEINRRALPSVFQTCCVSVRRYHAKIVGGFRDYYHGWGLEDRDMGARLLARGIRLVPCPTSAARQIVDTPQTTGPQPAKKKKAADEAENIKRYRIAMREPFRDDSRRLDHRVNKLLRAGSILERISLAADGRPVPAGRRKRSLPFDVLATVARAFFADANANIGRLTRRICDSYGPASLPAIGPGDLKWNLMIEDRPGGNLVQHAYYNMEDEPDRSLVLEPGSGWNGRCLSEINGNDRKSKKVLEAAAGQRFMIDLRDWTDEHRTTELRHSKRTLERTRHIKFIISYPLRVPIGDSGDFYCIGFFNVHSARPEIISYFSLSDSGAQLTSSQPTTTTTADLFIEIDITLKRVRDTIEAVHNCTSPMR